MLAHFSIAALISGYEQILVSRPIFQPDAQRGAPTHHCMSNQSLITGRFITYRLAMSPFTRARASMRLWALIVFIVGRFLL